FAAKEIVIAVGTYMIPHLVQISADVIKLRYNHGLPAEFDTASETAWSRDIPSITVSGTLVPRLEELAPNTCLGVVPNGIDQSQYFDMDLERNGIGVFYGRHPNKAPDFIKSVLAKLHETLPETPLYLVSTEECPKDLSFVQAFRLPPVETVRETYNRCRVWLLPSDTEGLPGPVLEAMSCGTLVVSTDNDGSLEIIEHDKNGLISPRRNLDAFVSNVRLGLNDDVLWERLTRAGKARAAEFSWDAAVDKMERIIRKLWEKHQHS
ncbi:MAG: glycosyltransferase family 4 protein, partial [Pseudomonadota bacterium]